LERILVVMAEHSMFPSVVERAPADVLMTVFDAGSIPEALKLAGELRASNLRVDLYPEPDKLGKQMKYAASKQIPFVAILGADELARGEVTIKNLTTGTQQSRARATVAQDIQSQIANSEPRSANRDSEETA
jgi:histidyl-tRNA synthetase